jgi:hypothetical protein
MSPSRRKLPPDEIAPRNLLSGTYNAYLDNEQYDLILSQNIVFLDLFALRLLS